MSGAAQPEEMRQAKDGCRYSREQFYQHYGLNMFERQWNAASPSDVVQLTDSPADDTTSDAPPSDVLQLTDSPADDTPSDVPQQGNPPADDPISTGSRVHTNMHMLTAYPVMPKMGGRQACEKQRELRQLLLGQDAYDHDLTQGSWPWQAILRAQPLHLQQLLVGPGIQKFSFRLLPGVMDSNYARIDAGYRHVFEIQRVDGSCYHLHYHKNGKCDPPSLFSGAHNQVPGSGASQPADAAPYQLHNIDYSGDGPVVRNTAEIQMDTPTIGRNETLMACTLILKACMSLDAIGVDIAVDITDGQTFAWRRWMRIQVGASEMIGPGLVKLFVVRWGHDDRLQIACCRTDNLYTLMPVSGSRSWMSEPHRDWRNATIFRSPWVIPHDWMKLRIPN